MLLYRLSNDAGSNGIFAATDPEGGVSRLECDPLTVDPADWTFAEQLSPPGSLPQGLLAPLQPSKIVGIGRNYRDHAEELGNPMPEEPLIFLKAPSSLIGPGTPILLPPESRQVDFEGEIAVVLGRRLRRVSREEAVAGILGVTCACDVTARDLQRRDKTFARGKSFDTFCPLGPAVAVQAKLEDLEVRTFVNGKLRQEGHVRDMAWGLPDLVSYVSQVMTLLPGDLLLTGTPAGVGSLTDGDLLRVEIPGVGSLENPVKAELPA